MDAHTIDLEELKSSESNITSFRMVDPTSRNMVSLRTVVNDWIYGEGKKGVQINVNESKVLVSIFYWVLFYIDQFVGESNNTRLFKKLFFVVLFLRVIYLISKIV